MDRECEMSAHKFRPSLTEGEILYLLDLLQSDTREATHKVSTSLHSKLKVFVMKAQLGIVSPAYTAMTAPKMSLAEALQEGTPSEKRHNAYSKFITTPYLCSKEELSLAMSYKYEHDLMVPEEEEAYESGDLLEKLS